MQISPHIDTNTDTHYTLIIAPMHAHMHAHIHTCMHTYVVVQFFPWFKFYFLLFWGMV